MAKVMATVTAKVMATATAVMATVSRQGPYPHEILGCQLCNLMLVEISEPKALYEGIFCALPRSAQRLAASGWFQGLNCGLEFGAFDHLFQVGQIFDVQVGRSAQPTIVPSSQITRSQCC